MKKLLLLIILFCASCHMNLDNVKPIEKYKGYVYLGWAQNTSFSNSISIYVKNSDTVFEVEVMYFDVANLKTGDTIK